MNVSTVAGDANNNTTSTTSLIQDITINMSGESQPRATTHVLVVATEEQRIPAKRRLWNYDFAHIASEIGKAKKLQDVEECGKTKIMHPFY